MHIGSSNKTKEIIVLVILVVAGAALYFGFFNRGTPAPVVNNDATPNSKLPAKENILGLDKTPDLNEFIKTEYDRLSAECKAVNPKADLAMGVYSTVRDAFAAASLGCGETGESAYYAKVNGSWQFAFKASDTPICAQVDQFSFTKEIIPECLHGETLKDNQNP